MSAFRWTAISSLTRLALGTVCLIGAPLVYGQSTSPSDPSATLTGILQSEADYSWIARAPEGEERDRIGLGLRRVRLQATGRLGAGFGAFVHLDADGGSFGVLDAFIMYQPDPRVRIRLGRMASAQPRAFILTPVIAMDATERAAIALLWQAGTLGSKGRDFGVDVRYLDRRIEAILFVHNGDGSFDRMLGNMQPTIVGDVTGGVGRGVSKMAVSTYIALRPPRVRGLEVGGFAGYNGARGPSTEMEGEGRSYVSYAAHAYWGAEPGSQPVRLKADVIGVRYEARGNDAPQHTLGLSTFGALAVHRAAEVFGRFETYDPDAGEGSLINFYVTSGVSFSPSKLRGLPFPRERLTLGYGMRISEDGDTIHSLLQLQIQVVF